MSPKRTRNVLHTPTSKKFLVEEYYWAGEMVTYVDHRLSAEKYDATCRRLEKTGEFIKTED